ncbi:unnamed protein product [Brachionus calyciflorus]|uniref:Uncharacterized protein n=1 Tax=Brachionus calyciflorus TaxID=104777 RepID=A0A813Y650_9BILA|nr:unnamed protein product [Brachionus calyciflorus]
MSTETNHHHHHLHLPFVHHHHHHVHWENPIEFLMTCIGFAVGLGNVWRFPFLCFQNGGSAFVIAFVIMLVLIGLPLFFLELTISQFSKCGPLKVWKISPLFRGLGLSSVILTMFVCLYYNVIICYCLVYLVSSFVPKLPWISCDNWWNTDACFIPSENSTLIADHFDSPSKQFFYKFVLEMSDGIDNPIGMNWKLVCSLFVCWMLAFLSLYKGIQSLGKVSYVTAIFPYIMLFALIIRGVTLPGSMKGIIYYIGSVDLSKLLSVKTWIDAASQVYFCLSIAQGGLITLGKHNKFNYNHQRTSFFVVILDGLTGLIAGLAVFSVLGFMSEKTGVEVKDLAVGGPGLSFIVYPEALSLMPFPWIWCIFFFLMMITIGFGSLLSLAECVLDSLIFYFKIQKKVNKTIFRFVACMLFFLFGCSMTTKGGYYLLSLIESYTAVFPVIIFATFEAIALCWCYGTKRINEDIKLMLNFELNAFWKLCFNFCTPVLAIIIGIITLSSNTEVTLGSYRYPYWAHLIGWAIIVINIGPLVKYAVCEIYQSQVLKELYKLTQPSDDWKPVFDAKKPEENAQNEINNTTQVMSDTNENGRINSAYELTEKF